MNWFLWNYMNLVVNVLHMLLTLSLSVSTNLLDIRKNFLMNLSISAITLVSDWSLSVVHVILPRMLLLPHPSGLLCRKLCMSFMWCVPSWVGTDPFQPGKHLHLPLPSKCWNLSYMFLDSLHQSHFCYWQSYLTCLCETPRSRHCLTTHYWDSYTKWS